MQNDKTLSGKGLTDISILSKKHPSRRILVVDLWGDYPIVKRQVAGHCFWGIRKFTVQPPLKIG
jgi:hypothetical protein